MNKNGKLIHILQRGKREKGTERKRERWMEREQERGKERYKERDKVIK